MENLEEIYMDYCSLTYIPNDIFHNLKYLRILDLSGNSLTNIPNLKDFKFLSTTTSMQSSTSFIGNYLNEDILRENLPDRLIENEDWFRM